MYLTFLGEGFSAIYMLLETTAIEKFPDATGAES